MDFWNIPKQKVKEAAERKYGKTVKEVYITTGLWANVYFTDGHIESIYEHDIER